MTDDLAEAIRKAAASMLEFAILTCHYCDDQPVIHLAYGCDQFHVNIRHLCAICADDMERNLENHIYRCHDCDQPYTCWMSRDRNGIEYWHEIT